VCCASGKIVNYDARVKEFVVKNSWSGQRIRGQEDVKKLILETWSNFGLEKIAPGCLISDRWGFGIHFGSDEISAKSIFFTSSRRDCHFQIQRCEISIRIFWRSELRQIYRKTRSSQGLDFPQSASPV
jgi:hypothetical protein